MARSSASLFLTLATALYFCFASFQCQADQAYIKEVEGLLNSLSSKDTSRLPLSLRLADAYFDETVRLTSTNLGVAPAQAKMYRHKAIGLYEESLTGFNGLFSKPSGDLRAKIKFQLARLYSDDESTAKAQEIWNSLIQEESPPDIKRESVLRIAEALEQKRDSVSLEGARKFYLQALDLCGGLDVCSYSHYRLAWVYRTQHNYLEALKEMQKALWDSKGQIREESLRDLIVFLAEQPGDGHDALSTIEDLDNKLHRSTLELDLSRAFYSAGNRLAGTYVLEHVNKRHPEIKNFVSLLEEYYGFRDWQKFRGTLDDLSVFRVSNKETTSPDVEVEKILRRLTVQLDGERTTSVNHADDFKNTVMLYLSFFPNGVSRSKMIDGWLVAENNSGTKISQLEKWIIEEKTAGRKKEELRLREMRASEAQKIAKYDIISDEMKMISILSDDPIKRRESEYQRAYALYQNKNQNEALSLFRELATSMASPSFPDSFAIQSQHLALDILGQQKAYKELLAQVRTYTNNPDFDSWIRQNPKHADELRSMRKIEQSAEFEGAVAAGATPDALKIFKEYCDKGLEMPKACDNARVLAFKLKNEEVLISVLKKQGRQNELITELEISGYFGEAASQLRGELSKQKTFKDYLKVALLYELGGDLKKRDEVLKTITALASNQKSFGADEDLIYNTLKEADLLNQTSLKLPFKKENHLRLVILLEEKGLGTPETHKIFLTSCENLGPMWERTAFTELEKMDQKQRQIIFTGKQSKRKFEQRLVAMKKFNTSADCYLQGSSAKNRVLIATLLAHSQYDLAKEITSSPIPEGLDAEVMVNLKKSLEQMAEPFSLKGKGFEELAHSQLEKITNPVEKLALQRQLDEGHVSMNLLSPEGINAEKNLLANGPNVAELDSATAMLHANPSEPQPLERLKTYYESIGKPRLAAYFQGRLKQLQSLPQQVEGK